MNFKPLALFLLSSLFLLPTLSAQPTDESRELDPINMSAYLALMDGDRAMRENKPGDAAANYKKALSNYNKLKSLNPDYKTTIVDIRINYLQGKLEQLSTATEAGAGGGSESTIAGASGTTDYKQLYIDAKEEAVSLSSRLLQLEKKSLDQERMLSEKDLTLDEQRRELVTLRRQTKDLESGSLKEISGLRRDLKDTKSFNALLQERQEEQKAKIENMEMELAARQKSYNQRDEELTRTRVELADLLDQHETQKRKFSEQTAFCEAVKEEARAAQKAAERAVAELKKEQKRFEENIKIYQETAKEAQAELQATLAEQLESSAKAENEWIVKEQNLTKEISGLTNQLQRTTLLWEESQAQLLAQAESFNELTATLEKSQSTVADQQEELQLTASLLSDAKDEIDELRTLVQADTNGYQTTIQRLEQELAQKTATWETERQAAAISMEQLAIELNQQTDLKVEVEELRKSYTQELATSADLREQITQLTNAETQANSLEKELQKLKNQIGDHEKLVVRLTQDADFSRGEMEQLIQKLERMRNERIDLLAAMQDKDEEIISLATSTTDMNLQIKKLERVVFEHDALIKALRDIAPKNGSLQVSGKGGKTIEIQLPKKGESSLILFRKP